MRGALISGIAKARRVLACLCVVLSGWCNWAVLDLARVDPPAAALSNAVSGQILVRFRSNLSAAKKSAALKLVASNVRFLHDPPRLAVQAFNAPSLLDELAVVEIDPRTDLETALRELRGHAEIQYAEPNLRLRLAAQEETGRAPPNDFDFSQQWALRNTGQFGGTDRADIHATEAWQYGTGSRRVKVAIIDTGIDYFHPDLAENIWLNRGETEGNGEDDDGNGYIDDIYGYDFVSDDGDPLDDNGHGTHVAGIIGALGNNQMGVTGVCWEVTLMAVKAFDENGESDIPTVVQAIHYAVANGAKIINASWGVDEKSQALQDAIAEARAAGVLFVAAAGNENNDRAFYPAFFPQVLAVGATNDKDQKAYFSNFGPRITVSAPGDNILSTIPNNAYEFLSGTSMAAPFVSGLAALILSNHPEFTADEVANIIRNRADPLSTDKRLGAGRINAERAAAVSAPLPFLELDLPDKISGIVPITGTVRAAAPVRYVLEYGHGINPTNWTEFSRSEPITIEKGSLAAEFYTPVLDEGVYTFRILGTDRQGQSAESRVLLEARNVQLTSPLNNDIIRAGDEVPINGTVFGRGRTFKIEYGVGPNPISWSDAGIHLTGGGTKEVFNSVLATWDTAEAPPNNFYTLRLLATDSNGQVETGFVYMLFVDSRLKPGWPQHLSFSGDLPTEVWREMTVADLDGDGRQEIVAIDPGSPDGKPTRLLVFSAKGELLWSRALTASAPFSDAPLAGDIDGDGVPEIFVDSGNQLFGFRNDGTPLGGNWPIKLEATALGKVLADLKGDGHRQLVCYAKNPPGDTSPGERQLLVIDAAGAIVQKWSLENCDAGAGAEKLHPAVGSFGPEPGRKIVAVSGCDQISCFDLNKAVGPLWTATVQGLLVSSPVIGDLNHDGTNEVIVACYDPKNLGAGGVYVFDDRGELAPGWPVLVGESFLNAPALADLDGDGHLEIILASESKSLHVLGPDGFEDRGWPVGPLYNSVLNGSCSVGDVDGDGHPDIVLASPGLLSHAIRSGDVSFFGGLRAWNRRGGPIDLSPNTNIIALPMESGGGSSFLKAAPVILTDLDGNGKLDVLAASIQDAAFSPTATAVRKMRGSLYVWELDAPYDPEALPWPGLQGNLEHTGGFVWPKPKNKPPQAFSIPDQIIPLGGEFFPIELDSYVRDSDNAAKELVWTVQGNRQLKVEIDPNRVARVIPSDGDWIGTEAIEFSVRDPEGLADKVIAHFSVQRGYVPPLAVADRAQTDEDTPIRIEVLANDSDPQGNLLSITQVSRPRFGTARIEANRVVFTPAADFNGLDHFTYTISNGRGGMAMGEVFVEVAPVNDPPRLQPDRVMTPEDTPVLFDPLANDVDAEHDAFELIAFGQPENGTVERLAGSQLRYAPKTDFNGLENFDYVVRDAVGAWATNTVTIMVKPVEDAPVARDQSFTLNRNASVNLTFLANDADKDELKYRIIDGTEHGDLLAFPTVATYYPKKGFSGTDSFTYSANDGRQESPPATVTFHVLDANNPPDAQNQALATKPDQKVVITLKATDLDGDPISYRMVDLPAEGTLSGQTNVYTYQPRTSFLGNDHFTFIASDGQDDSRLATVSILVTETNAAPIAEDMSLTIKMNQSTNFVLRASDGESDPLALEVVTEPFHGTLTGDILNTTYTPASGFVGSDRIRYQVNDGALTSQVATVWIKILPLNDPPTATNQTVRIAKNSSTVIDLAVLDPNGDALRTAILRGPQNGRLAGRGARFTYSPKRDFVGTDTFTYKSWDGNAYGNAGKVTVIVSEPSAEPPPGILGIQVLADGSVRLGFRAQSGKAYRIDASDDLMGWTAVASGQGGVGELSFTDPEAAKFKKRFYRLIQE